jgi:hypothetical protein
MFFIVSFFIFSHEYLILYFFDLYLNLCLGHFDLRTIQNYMISILQTFELSQNNIKSATQSKGVRGSSDSTAISKMFFSTGTKNLQAKYLDNDVTYLEDVNSYYNKAFASKLQASIVYEIIQVLTETFCISQVSL